MLHLNRNVGQSIFIGDDIVVKVIKVHTVNGEHRALIGIKAPTAMKVCREEVVGLAPEPRCVGTANDGD